MTPAEEFSYQFCKIFKNNFYVEHQQMAARKKCSENIQKVYRRTPMPKCDFIKVALLHGCSPVNLLYIFRTPFPKSNSKELLLKVKSVEAVCKIRSSNVRNIESWDELFVRHAVYGFIYSFITFKKFLNIDS